MNVIKQAVREVFKDIDVATKKDLKPFATKEDLGSYVTKDYLDIKLDQQKGDIVDEFKNFRSDFYEKVDPVLKEVAAAQHRRNRDRIERLEKIHPQGKHLATT